MTEYCSFCGRLVIGKLLLRNDTTICGFCVVICIDYLIYPEKGDPFQRQAIKSKGYTVKVKPESVLSCSFCGTSRPSVKALIWHPNGFGICDRCVWGFASEILLEVFEKTEEATEEDMASEMSPKIETIN